MKRSNWIMFAALFGASFATHANRVVEWRLEDKVAKADLVLVGTVVAVRPDESMHASAASGYAKIGVTALLKGNAGNSIELRFGSTIAELAPDCCVTGQSYLFFLSEKGGMLRPVNPPFGIVRIPPLSLGAE